jgi:hypothetical protein
MAIRKSMEEDIHVNGQKQEVMSKCNNALNKGGFKDISVSDNLSQLSAKYSKITVCGEIIVSLLPEANGTRIHLKTTANVDNVFALFNSPNKAIMNAFKSGI